VDRIREVLRPTAVALRGILDDFLERRLPHRRVARLAGLLLHDGVAPDARQSTWVVRQLLDLQQPDGGWVDCEDTAWCAYVLRELAPADTRAYEHASEWLAAERAGGAWGYCHRDEPCIPITATVRLLLSSLRDEPSAAWLRDTWAADLEGPFQLSYKAAWYLLARGEEAADRDLAERTVAHLVSDQREDGGWGPWRDHPAPTDCFSTGIAMWALADRGPGDSVTTTLDRAVEWCARSRLETGLFPTHFIEEGSAWLLLGWSAALRRLGA